MSFPYEQFMALPESVRLLKGKLTRNRIVVAINASRENLGAATKCRVIRKEQEVIGGPPVKWSLWIGSFEDVPAWFESKEILDIRHAFVLLLEIRGFVAVSASLAGDFAGRLGLDNLDYATLVNLHSNPSTEYDGISIRSLQPSTTGVSRTSLSGQRLEQTVSRIMAHRAVPTRVSFTTSGNGWRISPITGRVGRVGLKVHMEDLCQWFSDLVKAIEGPGATSAPFIESFAHPQSLSQIGVTIQPKAFQLDSGVIQQRLEEGWDIEIPGGGQVAADALAELLDRFNAIWDLSPILEVGKPPTAWKIIDSFRELGELVLRDKKISLRSPYLSNIQVVDPAGQRSSLKSWFNDGTVPFLVSFDDPGFAYYVGQLFRDHQLVANTVHLVEALKGDLPPNTVGEKKIAGAGFHPMSLFGFTEEYARDDDFIICEDLDKEWADYITVSASARIIRFFHCKGGSPAAGASGLHEVVAQALKNLGFLTAGLPDLERRRDRWASSGIWDSTSIPRLRKGTSVDDFIKNYNSVASSPRFSAKIVLVVSGLSKSAIEQAFARLRAGDNPGFNVNQLLWLLSFFVDGCRLAGAVPEIICEP